MSVAYLHWLQLMQLERYKDFDIVPLDVVHTLTEEEIKKIIALYPQVMAAENRVNAAQAQIEITKALHTLAYLRVLA